MGEDREEGQSRDLSDDAAADVVENPEHSLDQLAEEDRTNEHKVASRMTWTWIAALLVIVLWFVVNRAIK